MIDRLLVNFILAVLAISTVIDVLDIFGFLPRPLKNWIHRNKVTDTIQTLKELGVDVPGLRRREIAHNLPALYSGPDIHTKSLGIATEFYLAGKKSVGSINAVDSPGFIDIMGATTDPKIAELTAKLLISFWREQIAKPAEVVSPKPDFIVSPKSGSPLLAYEFSKLVHLPLVLHNSKRKFESVKGEISASFDTSIKLKKGMLGLIVDDSTTGGAKILSLIDDMEDFGLKFSDALVFFEPRIKNPRIALDSKGVKLHSILKFNSNGTIT